MVAKKKEPTEIKTRKVRDPTKKPVKKDEKEQKIRGKKKSISSKSRTKAGS